MTVSDDCLIENGCSTARDAEELVVEAGTEGIAFKGELVGRDVGIGAEIFEEGSDGSLGEFNSSLSFQTEDGLVDGTVPEARGRRDRDRGLETDEIPITAGQGKPSCPGPAGFAICS